MKIKFMIVTFALGLGISVPAALAQQNVEQQQAQVQSQYEQDAQDQNQWADKLGRGVVNVFTSPIEVAKGIDLTSKETNAARGWTVGLVKGVAGSAMRFGSGLIEVVTFPFNWPKENKQPIMDPDYVWNEWEGGYLDDALNTGGM